MSVMLLGEHRRTESTLRLMLTLAKASLVFAVFVYTGILAAVGQTTVNTLQRQPDSLDQKLLVVSAHTDLTDQVQQSVLLGLSLLPQSAKQRFIDYGVTVVITPNLEQLNNKSGRSEYSSATKQAIVCEKNTDGSKADLPRLHIITLHELGHANDMMLGYPSKLPEFRALYNEEAPKVPQQDRDILSHFLMPGNFGPTECYASLFVCSYYNGNDRRLTRLKADFPKCFDFVKNHR
jgi:hypothetical protein